MYTYDITTDVQSAKLNLDKLQKDITESSISTTLDGLYLNGDSLSVSFIETLDAGEKSTLDALILNHDGEPIPENVVDTGVLSTPFASKIVAGGKLYRRKHGIRSTVSANSAKSIKFTVPYEIAKIDEVEIINCAGVDTVDLKILDSDTGTYTTVPNYLLNQFGFDVNLSDIYYTDASNYDAELNIGMQIEIIYKNNEPDTKSIGINFVLHEVKATQ